ncbi:MAG: hypothetical protein QOF78_2881 [Phycisphaerales bacterium]|nr:hypothetical protein [Phycisphaerales bacterium]
MNDPRQPVQPAPAAPAMPRPVPAPAPGQTATMPRPATAPQPLHAPQQVRPVASPGQHAPHPAHAPHAAPVGQPHAAPQGLPRQPAGNAINPATVNRAPVDDEAISLVEDGDDNLDGPAPATPSKIKFGADIGVKKHAWKRQLKQTGSGACRVRTFHGKLSDQGLDYIDEAINVWLDDHPDVDIKFVTTNVGMFDGKFKDLALIVNVWY